VCPAPILMQPEINRQTPQAQKQDELISKINFSHRTKMREKKVK